MTDSQLYIGLISGTSVDGVDCALVDFAGEQPTLLATHGHSIPASLRSEILRLCEGEGISLSDLGSTNIQIGKLFAEAANALLRKAGLEGSAINAIGSHGQTVWHEPDGDNPFTLQLGDGNTIAQLTGITTVADLRGRDMTVGGQGAPLAPLLHRAVFHDELVDRAVINIGGFGNITALPGNGSFVAFDTGPGNVLMDYWIEKHLGKNYDANGEWAASGTLNLTLLNTLLDEPYFSKPLPKSTGRELFNGNWLEAKLSACKAQPSAEDVQATLLNLTATTIVSALNQFYSPQEIYVCGGGAHNTLLMEELDKLAGETAVVSTANLGIDPDWVEAMAFAWMAKESMAGRKIDTSAFTGASESVYLGAIYRS